MLQCVRCLFVLLKWGHMKAGLIALFLIVVLAVGSLFEAEHEKKQNVLLISGTKSAEIFDYNTTEHEKIQRELASIQAKLDVLLDLSKIGSKK